MHNQIRILLFNDAENKGLRLSFLTIFAWINNETNLFVRIWHMWHLRQIM